MTKQQIIEQHTDAVDRLRKNRKLNANGFGEFMDPLAEEMDKSIQREVSILGQAYNPRISRKAQVALGW